MARESVLCQVPWTSDNMRVPRKVLPKQAEITLSTNLTFLKWQFMPWESLVISLLVLVGMRLWECKRAGALVLLCE